jgi:hypothetical protein
MALDIGVPYSVPNYPAALNPATGGCRNMTGQAGPAGTVTIWAITSTISTNGDQGADPNKLVRVKDDLSATTPPAPMAIPMALAETDWGYSRRSRLRLPARFSGELL